MRYFQAVSLNNEAVEFAIQLHNQGSIRLDIAVDVPTTNLLNNLQIAVASSWLDFTQIMIELHNQGRINLLQAYATVLTCGSDDAANHLAEHWDEHNGYISTVIDDETWETARDIALQILEEECGYIYSQDFYI